MDFEIRIDITFFTKLAVAFILAIAFVIPSKVVASNAETYFSLGQEYLAKGNFDMAVLSFGKAISIDPNWAEAHNALGEAYFQLFKFKEAMAEFNKALELKPDYTMAKINRTRTTRAMERYQPMKDIRFKLWHKIAIVSVSIAIITTASIVIINHYSN